MKRFHVGKNLFDDNYVNAYLTANGLYVSPDTTTKSIIVKCEPNTIYTIKQVDYTATRHKWRIAVFDSIPSNNAQGTLLVNDESLSESTITTLADSAYIVVYYMYPTPLINAKFMINLGSTALPYEPYSSEWQTKSPPKYGTDTDIITDLPQEIITDGQPIGANLLPPPSQEQSGTLNGITYYVHADGSVDLSGIAEANVTITIDLSSEFTIPVSASQGGGGTIALNNSFINASSITLLYNATVIDSWGFSTPNRTSTSYSAMANKTINRYSIGIVSGTNLSSGGKIGLAFSNNGTPVTPYQPYAPTIIKGNMIQSGTPSPSSVIMPSECGDLTGNLLDRDTETKGVYVGTDGEEHSSSGWSASDYIPLDASTAYYISISTTAGNSPKHCFYDANKEFISYIASGSRGFTTPNNAAYGRFSYTVGSSQVMLNTGSTALPYEPFGYKIPILSGGATTNKYLGQVQSTRKIKKLVLTGQENWEVFPVGTGRYFRYMISSTVTAIANVGICSHYKRDNIGSSTINTDIFTINAPSAGGNGVVISPSDVTLDTASDFKTYLQQQYANGTPVTVWYVLAEPTTGILNEPLRKIGDYADSVSVTGIPTTSGSQQFDVDTTLKPSEVDLTYHGWHRKEPMRKSANLFDKNANIIWHNNVILDDNGDETSSNSSGYTNPFIEVESNTTYALSGDLSQYSTGTAGGYRVYYYQDSTFISRSTIMNNNNKTFTTPQNCNRIALQCQIVNDYPHLDTIMLNKGSSVLPYAPYWE